MNMVNMFTSYKHEENHFTNSLFALLMLSSYDRPQFITAFLTANLSLDIRGEIRSYKVLQGIDGTADAEICGKDFCIRFETKIVSGNLTHKQVTDHLKRLQLRPEKVKRLVLLTPDDGKSSYIEQFLALEPNSILHLGWKHVFDYLEQSVSMIDASVFSELVRQFLHRIRERVFEQDIAGIIAKVVFGDKSQVHHDRYLDEMEKGAWTRWNTPKQYKSLDGTGRKLLIYDKPRQGITVEAEIQKVKLTNDETDYPWTNFFVPHKVLVFRNPIPLKQIIMLPGFENFHKERSPYRNLSQEQYRALRQTTG
jgi:hypothetical protein